MIAVNRTAVEMEKLLQIGEKFGLEGEKLLEFVEKQQKLEEEKEEKRRKFEEERRREEKEEEEKRRKLEEERRRKEKEREEKRRQWEEEREEKRRQWEEEREEKRRQLKEEKEERRRLLEERRRKEDEEREARRQERELRKSKLEAEISKLKEAAEVAKREHKLKLAQLAQGNFEGRIGVREDRANAPKLPSFVDGENVKSCIENDELLLACGKKVPLLSSACVEPLSGVRSKMPVVKGRVGEKTVDVLRDTGCSGVIVKKDLVGEDQFTGDLNDMLLIDNTARKMPIARIDVDTPYLKGQVEAQCLPDPIYDLVIGNVPGARAADDPDPSWQDHEACVVTTRRQDEKAGERMPLKVQSSQESPAVEIKERLRRETERSD